MQGDSPAYEFTQTFPRDFSQETYDMMAQTTLTATIYTGEEVYGTVALDLIDLLKGATQVDQCTAGFGVVPLMFAHTGGWRDPSDATTSPRGCP